MLFLQIFSSLAISYGDNVKLDGEHIIDGDIAVCLSLSISILLYCIALAIRRVTDLHCPIDNKQYKRMDIEHYDSTITSLDIISVNPLAQPFVHSGNTILDPHCPTSRGMGKWWPNENIYGS